MGDNINPFGEEPSQRLLSQGNQRSDSYRAQDAYGNASNEAFVNQQDLQFQNFQHTTINIDDGRGNKNTIGGPPIQPEPVTGDFGQQQQQQPAVETKAAHFWQLQYYSTLFNVDSKQVVERILRSMMPFKFSFMDTISSNPDFYGPFWIATTLIFILAASGNLYTYFTTFTAEGLTKWSYNFNLITVGAATFYGYTIVIPLILWGVLKYLQVPVNLLDTICIYGYSLFIYIPISIVCIIPLPLMQWILVSFACGLSGWFLLSNMIVPIKNASHLKKGLVIMVVLGGLHVGLALLYKLYFFQAVHETSSGN
jgi:hypothetical protein